MGPEQKRLQDRLFGDPNRKLVNFKITRGDKPATAEEICAEINKAMDEIESGRATEGPVMSERPKVDVRKLVADLERRS
ncbi:hypothetical protein [Bradyrhizobium sp. Tv2a-2]|uniref:hypothetical protein n=1 Tax=Bradyrhizobium sp. Tv2a-2 TaxID=113395 RepID=UPI0005682B0F|nr:hypothetical protein [Bradyrhizobium sp. Tv2a-2]